MTTINELNQYKTMRDEVEEIVKKLEDQKERVHSLVKATERMSSLDFDLYNMIFDFTERDLINCIDRLYRSLDDLERDIVKRL